VHGTTARASPSSDGLFAAATDIDLHVTTRVRQTTFVQMQIDVACAQCAVHLCLLERDLRAVLERVYSELREIFNYGYPLLLTKISHYDVRV
jgi:hypothetical protein